MGNPIIPMSPLPSESPLEPGIPATSPLGEVILYTRYVYPLTLFVFFLFTLAWWGISTSQSSRPSPPSVNGIYENGRRTRDTGTGNDGPGLFARIAGRFPGGTSAKSKRGSDDKLTPTRKAVFNWLLVGVVMTFVLNSASVIFHALTTRGWWVGQAYVICTVSLLFIYALMLISQIDNTLYPTLPHFASWILGICGESLLLGAKLYIYEEDLDRHKPKDGELLNTLKKKHGIFLVSNWEIIDLSIDFSRLFLLLLLVFLYLILVIAPKPRAEPTDSEESTPLLSGAASPSGSADYGASKTNGVPSPDEPAGWARKMTLTKQSWWEYLRGYAIFFPYLWPSKSRRLQFLMIICFILVILQRGVNVLVPDQLGNITNILAGDGQKQRLPWEQIVLYITYRFLQGNMGVLGALRSTLWVPIGQYSYQALSTSAFEHVHSLSLDFHLGKKTGEVLSALSKGNAINNFLEQISFQVVPMLVDLGVAIAYFFFKFDAYYALIVAIVTFCYLYITVRMAQWRADIRREMVNKSREEDSVKNDSMIAYETVKYFNAEAYEFGRYRSAVRAYQSAEKKVLLSLNVMNVTQNLVFTIGLVIACFLAAWQVTTGEIRVGKFVSLLAYLAQLQGPLNFFGSFYRSIQSSMINSERMLELFKEEPTVVDAPEAKKIGSCTGEITFKDVHFSYDHRKPALRGLDFVCKPGTTTALVGESGGGKTTVLRLLFRFYNIQQGSIMVDEQDVRDITIDSLRSKIGVVPQDTVLFNESVMYNLKYANPDATDEMVHEACRAASIHDKIMSFPDGYETKVGERGLRLSGGEKQRVAIARTILKDPKIILLDEATAALDSETEQNIQAALKELAKGRTTLVIAHRLSTITQANQILCLHEGKVIEAGTHEELLAKGGRYAMMWRKQIRAELKKAKLEETESESDDVQPLIDLEPSHPSKEPSIFEGSGFIPVPMHDPRDRCGAVDGVIPPSMLDIEPSPKRAAVLESGIPASPSRAPRAPTRAFTDSRNNSPVPGGKGKEREGLRRSGSAMSTASGGKWSAKGLKRALSMKGKNITLHKRSASSSGLLERAASSGGGGRRSGGGGSGSGNAAGTDDAEGSSGGSKAEADKTQ